MCGLSCFCEIVSATPSDEWTPRYRGVIQSTRRVACAGRYTMLLDDRRNAFGVLAKVVMLSAVVLMSFSTGRRWGIVERDRARTTREGEENARRKRSVRRVVVGESQAAFSVLFALVVFAVEATDCEEWMRRGLYYVQVNPHRPLHTARSELLRLPPFVTQPRFPHCRVPFAVAPSCTNSCSNS